MKKRGATIPHRYAGRVNSERLQETVNKLSRLTIPQVTGCIQDLASRAKLLPDGPEKTTELDFVARLVTALRINGVWPDGARPTPFEQRHTNK